MMNKVFLTGATNLEFEFKELLSNPIPFISIVVFPTLRISSRILDPEFNTHTDMVIPSSLEFKWSTSSFNSKTMVAIFS